MKFKLLKQFILGAVLVLLIQPNAKASNSQVVFRIPLHKSKFRLDTRTGSLDLTCKISSNGVRSRLKGFKIIKLTPRMLKQKYLSVTVKAKNSKSFKKRDKWNCKFEADGSANGDLDYKLSTMKIQGYL